MSTKPFDNTFLRVFSVSQIFNPEGGDENLLEANKNGFMRKKHLQTRKRDGQVSHEDTIEISGVNNKIIVIICGESK